MGPQVAYFMPQILIEMDLHGPDIDAQGAAFPGISPYVLLGRGQDYAWSATSAGQDIIDTFAEKLCEPDGSQPDVQSTHYLYKGECRAMEIAHAGEQHHAERRATPRRPRPTRSRRSAPCTASSTSAAPWTDSRSRSRASARPTSTRPTRPARSPPSTARRRSRTSRTSSASMHKINFTFNWFYADDRDIGYFNSGDNPVRAAGADPDFPNWGTGEYDWQGWETHLQDRRRTRPSRSTRRWSTRTTSRPGTTSRRPATTPPTTSGATARTTARSRSTSRSIPRIAGAGKMSLPEAIDSMEVAGTVDLRGTQVLPLLLQVVGTPSDPQLAARRQQRFRTGSTRAPTGSTATRTASTTTRTRSRSWTPGGRSCWRPSSSRRWAPRSSTPSTACSSFDNEPNNHGQHLGSAYQDGWWGYVSKDLRRVLGQSVSDGFSRTYCGSGSLTACRDALRQALSDALARAGEHALRRGLRHGRRAARRHLPGRQERPVVLRLGALPPDRRRSPCARSTGSTARPSSRPSRSRATAPAATPRPKGATPAAGLARAGLPGLRVAQPPARPAARVRLLQPAACSARTT